MADLKSSKTDDLNKGSSTTPLLTFSHFQPQFGPYKSLLNFQHEWKCVKRLAVANYGKVYLFEHLPTKQTLVIKRMANDRSCADGNCHDRGLLERYTKGYDFDGENPLIELGASASVSVINVGRDEKHYWKTCTDPVALLHKACNKGSVNKHGKFAGELDFHCPYILRMRGCWTDQQFTYYASDPCIKGELFSLVSEKKRLTEFHTRLIMRQIMVGVKWMHDRGIAHRDISLENVLLTDEPADRNARLMDMGVACSIFEENSATSDIRQAYQVVFESCPGHPKNAGSMGAPADKDGKTAYVIPGHDPLKGATAEVQIQSYVKTLKEKSESSPPTAEAAVFEPEEKGGDANATNAKRFARAVARPVSLPLEPDAKAFEGGWAATQKESKEVAAQHYDRTKGNLQRTVPQPNLDADRVEKERQKMNKKRKLVKTEGFVGKDYYRGPEVYGRGSKYYPAPTDIFSCGVMLFIMVTGRPIWKSAQKGDQVFEYLQHAGFQAIVKQWKLCQDPLNISPECMHLCERMVEFDPDKRATADEVLAHPWFQMDLPKTFER